MHTYTVTRESFDVVAVVGVVVIMHFLHAYKATRVIVDVVAFVGVVVIINPFIHTKSPGMLVLYLLSWV